MKLKTACEIGVDCGLKTVGEAVFNIDMHSISIFPYDKIREELTELYKEFNSKEENLLIRDKFPELYK